MLLISTCEIIACLGGWVFASDQQLCDRLRVLLSHGLVSGPIPGTISGEYDTARYWLVSSIPDTGVRALETNNVIINTHNSSTKWKKTNDQTETLTVIVNSDTIKYYTCQSRFYTTPQCCIKTVKYSFTNIIQFELKFRLPHTTNIYSSTIEHAIGHIVAVCSSFYEINKLYKAVFKHFSSSALFLNFSHCL